MFLFSSNALLYTTSDTGDTPTWEPVGAVQSCEINLTFQTAEVYAWGSVLRQDVSRYEGKIDVNLNFTKFSDEFGQNWFWKIIQTDYSGTGPVTVDDTTNMARFQIRGTFRSSTDNSKGIDCIVSDVVFSNFTMGGQYGEYVSEDLTGTGSAIKLADLSTVTT